MKAMRILAVLAAGAALTLAAPSMAQEAQPKGEEKPKEEPKHVEKKEGEKAGEKESEAEAKLANVYKDIDQVVGKVEAGEGDFKLFLKHYSAIDKLTKADAKFQELTEKNLKEAFDHLVKAEKFTAWAKENGVEAEKFLKVAMRIYLLTLKTVGLKATEEKLADSKKEIESIKDDMPADEYKQYMAMLDSVSKDIAAMRKAMAVISGPTEAEAKLIEANKAALLKLVADDKEWDSDEDDEDGMGGK